MNPIGRPLTFDNIIFIPVAVIIIKVLLGYDYPDINLNHFWAHYRRKMFRPVVYRDGYKS